MEKTTQDYVFEFFKENPDEEFKLKTIAHEVRERAVKETGDEGKRQMYVNRIPRKYAKQGYLPKYGGYLESPRRGVFIWREGGGEDKPHSPGSPFTEKMKKSIRSRDKNKCQMCGTPETNNSPIQVDHLVAEDRGGKGVLENGITLCIKCNNTKKNLEVTHFGKKLFERYLKISIEKKDEHAISFLRELLKVYDKHGFR